jgi:hypothetical protein
MSNRDPTGGLRMRTLGSRRDKQFLLLITHPLCYSYIQPSPVKVFALIEERKKSTSKVILDSLSSEIWIFCNGQIVMNSVALFE